MAWLTGWSYRNAHTITGTAAGSQTDYPMRVKVHYGSGSDSGRDVYCSSNCKTDFGDIRFTKADGSTLLDYWVESQVNSNNAVIWVEVDTIPASPTTIDIYIYYGKGDATTTSSGDNTFLFHDDFPGASVDTDKWEDDTGDFGVAGGNLEIPSQNGTNKFITTKVYTVPNTNVALRYGLKLTSTGADGQFYVQNHSSNTYTAWATSHRMSYRHENDDIIGNADISSISFPNTFSATVFQIMELRFYNAGTDADMYVDDVYKDQDTSVTSRTGPLLLHAQYTKQVWFMNFIGVRKFAAPEPAPTSWGGEETEEGEAPPVVATEPFIQALSRGGQLRTRGSFKSTFRLPSIYGSHPRLPQTPLRHRARTPHTGPRPRSRLLSSLQLNPLPREVP